MSTEERDKAAQTYADSMEADLTRNEREIARIDFGNGWDARGQVTPDREALVNAMIGSDALSPDTRAEAMVQGSTQREPFLMFADAILALFNEKGNE